MHFKLAVQHTEYSSVNYTCSELEWCNQSATLVLQNVGEGEIISDEGIYINILLYGTSPLVYQSSSSSRRWTSFNPFRSYAGPCPTLWFSCSAPMSEDIRLVFVVSAPLSEPVQRFSSFSKDFGQQIAQVVLFLFLGRPCVLMWTGDCALYSRGCACRKMAGMTGVNK